MRERERMKQEIDELNEQRVAAIKEIRTNSVELATAIIINLNKLTDMAPGLNRNPFVQTIRTQSTSLLGQLEAL